MTNKEIVEKEGMEVFHFDEIIETERRKQEEDFGILYDTETIIRSVLQEGEFGAMTKPRDDSETDNNWYVKTDFYDGSIQDTRYGYVHLDDYLSDTPFYLFDEEDWRIYEEEQKEIQEN